MLLFNINHYFYFFSLKACETAKEDFKPASISRTGNLVDEIGRNGPNSPKIITGSTPTQLFNKGETKQAVIQINMLGIQEHNNNALQELSH